MIDTLKKIWKKPFVRRLAFWLGPIIFGWILSQFDANKKTAKKTSRRRR